MRSPEDRRPRGRADALEPATGPGSAGTPAPSVASSTDGSPVLALDHATRRFGGIVALDDVSFGVPAASVTCLLGENGAGKSTAIDILSGVQRPSAGLVCVDGRAVTLHSPRDARALGVATVYQTLALVPLMSVWRNFFLGVEPTRGRGALRRLDAGTCRRQARAALDTMGIDLPDVDAPVGTLSGGERQAIAIARALHFGARALILDEPTAALGVRQAEIVLDQVARARAGGAAVLLVTHHPGHALRAGDQFVVLRRGRVSARLSSAQASVERLSRLMAGEE
jgi:simple sugar transport system ATP-binding protein